MAIFLASSIFALVPSGIPVKQDNYSNAEQIRGTLLIVWTCNSKFGMRCTPKTSKNQNNQTALPKIRLSLSHDQ